MVHIFTFIIKKYPVKVGELSPTPAKVSVE